jgi:hypothetical protein
VRQEFNERLAGPYQRSPGPSIGRSEPLVEFAIRECAYCAPTGTLEPHTRRRGAVWAILLAVSIALGIILARAVDREASASIVVGGCLVLLGGVVRVLVRSRGL